MSTDPRPAAAPSPALVFETLFAYQRTAALRAAIELDLFRAIGEGPGDVASIARRCAASERGTRILCDFLTVIGLLSKTDGRYANTATSALFLDPLSPACVASTARFLGLPDIAVDWASVLEVALANAGRAGVRDRYETRAGSAFEVEYGGPHDVALLTNFLHHFDPPTCVGLLKKVHAALKRGGRIAALEFVPNEDRVSPPMAASFSLTMLATTAAGDAYTLPELAAMYREAGFADVSARPVPTGPHTVVVGHAV